MIRKNKVIVINGRKYLSSEVASFDVDAMYTFTPMCPGELPVPDGDKIVPELNEQRKYADYWVACKDAHSMASLWIDSDKNPQFKAIAGYMNLDIRWKIHGVPGTFGFKLIDGLPKVVHYQYFVWKGIEIDMHPYGGCFHDLHETQSTGVIEYLKNTGKYKAVVESEDGTDQVVEYNKEEVRVVIAAGLATDYCLRLTVLQLLKAGFIVIVNLGGSRGIVEDTTITAIEEMKGSGAIIINSAKELENPLNN